MSAGLNELIVNALDDLKGKNVVQLDVRELSNVICPVRS